MEKRVPVKAEDIHLMKIDVPEIRIDAKELNETAAPVFVLGHRLMHKLKDSMIKIELQLSFKNKEEKELVFIQNDYYFKIDELERFFTEREDGAPIFSVDLVATLLGIAVSTSRGILYEKLLSNGVKQLIIPVLAPYKLLPKNQEKKT